jgi:hypothetical protein
VQTTCFWNNLHQVTFKIDRLERLIIKCFGSNKPKRSKQDSQHRLSYLCLRDDNLTCINNHIILELYILVINISSISQVVSASVLTWFISSVLVPKGSIRPVVSASVLTWFISSVLVPKGSISPVVSASVLTQHRLSYLCLRDDNLTCINNHIILELYILVINISNKPCQCRSTDCWADNTPGD